MPVVPWQAHGRRMIVALKDPSSWSHVDRHSALIRVRSTLQDSHIAQPARLSRRGAGASDVM